MSGPGSSGRGEINAKLDLDKLHEQHCVAAKSDARDAGQVFRYLRGPMQGRIVDLTCSDAADLYHHPRPTWVAAALVEWRLGQATAVDL